MHVNRKGNEVMIAFDTEEEAQGLYAYLTGTIHTVPEATAAKGQWLYNWFFTAVQKLAINFHVEKDVKTQSNETERATATPTTSPARKPRKR